MKPKHGAKSGSGTLLMSILMSAPGPLVVGLGLLAGRSSTQIADFIRRSAELLAIIASYVVFCMTQGRWQEKRRLLERGASCFVGAMMLLAGSIMAVLAFASQEGEKGNVIPGLTIALLGVIANCIFWRRYTSLSRAQENAVLAVQARLYGAKTLVDGGITVALLSLLIAPGHPVSALLDTVGSVVVALYLMWCGGRTVFEGIRAETES